MSEVRPASFSELALRPCPAPDDLSLALAADLWDGVRATEARGRLDALGIELRPAAAWPPLGAAMAFGRLLARALGCPAGAGTLRLDDALDGADAHPLVRTAIAVAIGQRAGLEATVAWGEGRWLVACRYDSRAILLDLASARPEALSCDELPDGLGLRCSHQLAEAILDHAGRRAFAAGELARAVRARELASTLRAGEPDAAGRPAAAARN